MYDFSFLAFGEALLLVLALSVDSFVASFAYGASGIKVPWRSVIVMNVICTGLLAASLYLGAYVSPYVPPDVTKYVCFSILLAIGLAKLAGWGAKLWVKRASGGERKLRFKLFDLRFLVSICFDSTAADRDENKILSAFEAVPLAIAVSLDGLAVGFSAGIAAANPILVIVFSFAIGMLLVPLGSFVGVKLSKRASLDLAWLAGLILIVLAVLKLV